MKRDMSLRSKLTGKTKTRIIVLYVSIAIILVGFIATAVFLFLNQADSEETFAAGSVFSSSGTGNWTTNATWVSGTAPATTNINGDDITINSNHVVSSGTLDVLNNATFTISSN